MLQLEEIGLQEDGLQSLDSEVDAIRMQAALVRSLLEELDELVPPGSSSSFGRVGAAQTIDELTQLACRMLSVAASVAPQRVQELCLRQRWASSKKA